MMCSVWMNPGCLQTPRRRDPGTVSLSPRTSTMIASGRPLKPRWRKVEAEFTVPTELQPSFKSHHRLLISGSRNCKSVSATSNHASGVSARWKYEFHENHEGISAFLLCFSDTYEWQSTCLSKCASWP